MLILLSALAGIVSALLCGGSFRPLGTLAVRALWLPPAALFLQVLIIEVVPDGVPLLLSAIHLATYLMAGAFIWLNRTIPGLLLVATGALTNGVTIALNSGTLPARAGALVAAGLPTDPSGFVNSGVRAHPVLPWLGDVFAWPAPLPLANVFSVGDVLIVGGLTFGAHVICGSRLIRRRQDGKAGRRSRKNAMSPA